MTMPGRAPEASKPAAGGRVAVVGAGISGLVAAYELRRTGIGAVVLEAGGRPGGMVDSVTVGGLAVDSGPDGFVIRDPAAADLCRCLGLGAELVEPAVSGAYVWVNGRLRPLPDRSVLGVPWTASAVAGAGIVSDRAVDVLARGLAQYADPLAGDASVGEVLRPRVGDEVFECLVDPLLGGINAGSADQMSIEACAPPLFEAARRGGALGPALREVATRQDQHDGHTRQDQHDGHTRQDQHDGHTRQDQHDGHTRQDQHDGHTRQDQHDGHTRQDQHDGHIRDCDGAAAASVFRSVSGGVARIVEALASELAGALSLDTAVQSVSRAPARGSGFRWTVTTANGALEADGVILACPAWESARLLEPLAPAAAAILAQIKYSDVALTTFAVRSDRMARHLDGSGYLVPRSQGLLTTACSWASSKWRHYAKEGLAILRVSAGRTDDRRWMDLDSAELTATLASELAVTGLVSAQDAARGRFEARVTPWMRSLPQYRPGHLERAAAVDACLVSETPGMTAVGAAFRGVGLPACVRGARTAAAAVARTVRC